MRMEQQKQRGGERNKEIKTSLMTVNIFQVSSCKRKTEEVNIS